MKFISCDWGTSNFRLRLVDLETLEILDEHKTDEGIKRVYNAFKQQDEKSQYDFFQSYLEGQLTHGCGFGHTTNTVVASGMITASIGMHEMAYADMPIDASGSNLNCKSLKINDYDVLLISGARTATDVMRGEETQIVGLANYITADSGVLILPGTHSKHIKFSQQVFRDFTTYMTGELFEIVSRHSILAASLEKVSWDEKYKTAYLEGVRKGVDNRFFKDVFNVRTNTLFKTKTEQENWFFLSGMLIGNELTDLKHSSEQVYLASSGVLNELYKLALESFLPAEQITCFDEKVIDKALLIGQKKIMGGKMLDVGL